MCMYSFALTTDAPFGKIHFLIHNLLHFWSNEIHTFQEILILKCIRGLMQSGLRSDWLCPAEGCWSRGRNDWIYMSNQIASINSNKKKKLQHLMQWSQIYPMIAELDFVMSEIKWSYCIKGDAATSLESNESSRPGFANIYCCLLNQKLHLQWNESFIHFSHF